MHRGTSMANPLAPQVNTEEDRLTDAPRKPRLSGRIRVSALGPKPTELQPQITIEYHSIDNHTLCGRILVHPHPHRKAALYITHSRLVHVNAPLTPKRLL
jgi:hypothetical protein